MKSEESEERNLELLPTTSKTSISREKPSTTSMQNLGAIAEDTVHKETVSSSNKETNKPEANPHGNSLNWYLADCDRERACTLLSGRKDGTYLIRPNLKQANPKYALSFVYQQQIKHILIEEDNSGCFLTSSNQQQPKRLASLGNVAGEKDAKTELHRIRSSSNTYSTISNLILTRAIPKLNDNLDSDYFTLNQEDKLPNESTHSKFKTLTELVCYYSKNPIVIGNINLNLILLYPVNINR